MNRAAPARARCFAPACRQQGITLVELMVSLAVGLIIVSALAFYFAGQKQTYTYQEALAGMQDGARTALIHISRDLRLAGYYGCVPQGGQQAAADAAPPNANVAPPAGIFSQNVLDLTTQQPSIAGLAATTPPLEGGWELAVMGQDNVDQVTWETTPSLITRQADRLVINRAEPTGLFADVMPTKISPIAIRGSVANADAQLAANNIVRGSPVAVADCHRAVVFAVSNNPTGTGMLEHKQAVGSPLTTDMKHIFGSDLAGPAQIYRMRRIRYYLSATRGQNSLYRCEGWPAAGGAYCSAGLVAEELVDGVDNLQVEYGVATSCNGDGTANYKYTPALATDPERAVNPAPRSAALQQTAQAVAVKVTLTLRARGIARDQYQVDENGNRSSRYRQQFSTVVELRNGCNV